MKLPTADAIKMMIVSQTDDMSRKTELSLSKLGMTAASVELRRVEFQGREKNYRKNVINDHINN
jgi:hypothetical protein